MDHHHRRWGFSPRPENVTAKIGGALIMAKNGRGTSSLSIPKIRLSMRESICPGWPYAHDHHGEGSHYAHFLPPTNHFALELGRKSTIAGILLFNPCPAYTSR
jgi:hypothetical protein